MGMLGDQLMGLNPWARRLVSSGPVLVYTNEITRVYPDGRRETMESLPVYRSLVKIEESGEFYFGTLADKYPLHKYTLPDGQVYCEKMQAQPWSTGRFFFLALQDENGNWVPESLWPEETVKEDH